MLDQQRQRSGGVGQRIGAMRDNIAIIGVLGLDDGPCDVDPEFWLEVAAVDVAEHAQIEVDHALQLRNCGDQVLGLAGRHQHATLRIWHHRDRPTR